MSRRVQQRLAAVGAFLALLAPSQAGAQKQKEWTWKDREGKTRTRAELEEILSKHKLWVASRGAHGSRADLSGAQMGGANLVDANLTRAKLDGADLSYADLRAAKFGGAALSGAILIGSHLEEADLSGAILRFAKLNGADLNSAKLIGSKLQVADLDGAALWNAEMKDADLLGADLQGLKFQPKSNPETRSTGSARHLEYMTYLDRPDALVQLRKQFQENGFRAQERKITYALKRVETERALFSCQSRKFGIRLDETRPVLWSSDSVVANCGAFVLNRVFFDWTCQYGMNPGRALQIWLALLLFCWLVYAVSIHVPGESGIYRLQKTGGPTAKEEIEEQIRPRTIPSRPLWRYPFRLIYQELRVFFWAGFFSLMSAFNIGFRDINFGRWLRLLPRTEYDLKAKGWARTVAGFQSLISVYLIALWVLTYFGRPFE